MGDLSIRILDLDVVDWCALQRQHKGIADEACRTNLAEDDALLVVTIASVKTLNAAGIAYVRGSQHGELWLVHVPIGNVSPVSRDIAGLEDDVL